VLVHADRLKGILVFAVGMPLVVSAILRGRILSRWLGWAILIPSVLVRDVGGLLLVLGYSIGGAFLGVGLNIFFVSVLILGILCCGGSLLRTESATLSLT
jgi:hypothetical protein